MTAQLRTRFHARLDGQPSDSDTLISQHAHDQAVGECLDWHMTASYHFRPTSHVNPQENRALRREIKHYSKGCKPVQNEMQICLVDSMVALGCIAKGRSSSFKLNGVLRSLAGFLITSNLHLAPV